MRAFALVTRREDPGNACSVCGDTKKQPAQVSTGPRCFEMPCGRGCRAGPVGALATALGDRAPSGSLSFGLCGRVLLLLGWLRRSAVAHDPQSCSGDGEHESVGHGG